MSHLHHKVSALVDGELQGAARRRAEAHVRRCVGCRRELEETLALKRRLAGLPRSAEPSADLFATLGSVACPPRAPGHTRSRFAVAGRRLLVGAGSMSVAVLSLAYVVGAPDEGAAAQVAPPIEEFSAEFAGTTGVEAFADPAVGALSGDLQPAEPGAGPPHDRGGSDPRQDSGGTDGSGGPGGTDGRGGHSGWGENTDVPGERPTTGSGAAFGAVVGSPVMAPADQAQAVRQLSRAATAPSRIAYVGTRRVDTMDGGGLDSASVNVRHSPDQGTIFRVLRDDDDPLATFLAHDEAAAVSALGSSVLVDSFDVSVVGADRVVGRAATVVATSQDGVLRARFWIDDETGLLLKRELHLDGRVVRASTFVSLRVVGRGFLEHLPPELAAPAATVVSVDAAPSLDDDGWTCPGSIGDDFGLTVLNRLQVGGDVMHAQYSDGLSTVSVFEARGALDASGLDGFEVEEVGGSDAYLRYGLPTVAVWESEGTVYTVVTDAPRQTAADVLAGLPHQAPAETGTTARVGSGLDTMASFLNPVD